MKRSILKFVTLSALFGTFVGTCAYAESVDLRSYFGAVRNQGDRGTCNVFGATGLMEFLIRQRTGGTIDLSEQYAYWVARHRMLEDPFLKEQYAGDDALAGFLAVEAFAANAAGESAALPETAWPYEPRNWQQTGDSRCKKINGVPQEECFSGIPPEGLRPLPFTIIPQFIELTDAGKFLLEQKKPVVVNMLFYRRLLDKNGNFTRLPTEAEIGKCETSQTDCYGHVILLVGYDSQTHRFVFRNSWGASWGDSGYGTMPEEYLVRHCEACRYRDADTSGWEPELKQFIGKALMGVSGTLAP